MQIIISSSDAQQCFFSAIDVLASYRPVVVRNSQMRITHTFFYLYSVLYFNLRRTSLTISSLRKPRLIPYCDLAPLSFLYSHLSSILKLDDASILISNSIHTYLYIDIPCLPFRLTIESCRQRVSDDRVVIAQRTCVFRPLGSRRQIKPRENDAHRLSALEQLKRARQGGPGTVTEQVTDFSPTLE